MRRLTRLGVLRRRRCRARARCPSWARAGRRACGWSSTCRRRSRRGSRRSRPRPTLSDDAVDRQEGAEALAELAQLDRDGQLSGRPPGRGRPPRGAAPPAPRCARAPARSWPSSASSSSEDGMHALAVAVARDAPVLARGGDAALRHARAAPRRCAARARAASPRAAAPRSSSRSCSRTASACARARASPAERRPPSKTFQLRPTPTSQVSFQSAVGGTMSRFGFA